MKLPSKIVFCRKLENGDEFAFVDSYVNREVNTTYKKWLSEIYRDCMGKEKDLQKDIVDWDYKDNEKIQSRVSILKDYIKSRSPYIKTELTYKSEFQLVIFELEYTFN